MKITLWGINYAPEAIGIAPFNRDLCEFLAGRGHDVTAVTAFSYYPHWRKETADQGRWHRAEKTGGVSVHRCWCYVPAAVTSLRRILHELSFGLTSLLRVLMLPRSDVYVVISPPLGLGFFAWVATRLKRSRFIFHVQDLQPDAAVGLGMLKRGRLVQALYGLERLAYAKAAVASGISGGMMSAFRHKGVAEEKCALLPNWLRFALDPAAGSAGRGAARARFEVPDGTLLAVYAGNLGRKQGLEIMVESAALLGRRAGAKVPRIKLIIAGQGVARPALEEFLASHPGVDVQLLPLLSEELHADLLRAADVGLITQAAGTGRFFLPSKLLSVLAAGLPVVAVADEDSELARAVNEGKFGCVVPPGDAAGLSAILQGLSVMPAQLKAWRQRTDWVRQFSREAILPRFEQVLLSIVRGPVPVTSAGLKPVMKPADALPA